MKLASWNVNSIRIRRPAVEAWFEAGHADLVLLQETKCQDAAFPHQPWRDRGWHTLHTGSGGYNGVGIVSREPLELVRDRLPGDDTDLQPRYLEALVSGLRVINVYCPNGNPAPGPKFDYKLAWMDRLARHLGSVLEANDGVPLVVGGDWNVIPTDADVWDPRAMAADALLQPETRASFRRILWQGFTEAFRALNPTERAWTFWDYQAGAWPRDQGLRIDHFLLDPNAAERLVDCRIDRGPRGAEQPSDHTPIVVELQ